MKTVSTAYLSLGSNLGNRYQNLQYAIELLNIQSGTVQTTSKIYENPPSGFEAKQDFLNLCLEIQTELTPNELLDTFKLIERELGRVDRNTEGYSSRPIDIDIIFFNDLILSNRKLTIPHPRFRERLFVLKPLNDIAPSKIDPETNHTIQRLYENCTDQSILRVYNPPTF